MKVVVVLIATGSETYLRYASPLIESLRAFFPPHDTVLFTDSKDSFDAMKIFQPHLGWPQVTLMRHHAFLSQEALLSQYDQIFFMDIDMVACSEIRGEDVFSDGITAVLHASYPHPDFPPPFETNPVSTARVLEAVGPYYCGGWFGGDSGAFLRMSKVIARNIDIDNGRGVVARWHDESHLNCYLAANPPAKVLTPAYCFPDPKYLTSPERWMGCDPKSFIPKMRHLEKPPTVWELKSVDLKRQNL